MSTVYTAAFAILLCACSDQVSPLPAPGEPISDLTVDSLRIDIGPDQQREYSFTDKKAAFWYGLTHTNDWHDYYAGWNIAKRRLLSDYTLWTGSELLDREFASVAVYPYKLEREYPERAHETFQMFDNVETLLIEVDHVRTDSISIMLSPRLISSGMQTPHGVIFTPEEAPECRLNLLPFNDVPYSWDGSRMTAPAQAGGFIVNYLRAGASADSAAATFRATHSKLSQERKTRMDDLVRYFNPLQSNCDSLDKAMAWIILTTDELITRQQGNGIYAGLPWFNEYWGRDMFISLPGATLCTGQWQAAKSILWDFARFQDTIPHSPTLGRIPNRANPEGIIYNTADGTPRFVIDIYKYLSYTGDTDFLASIYPAVALSVNAALDNQTDADGYLLHADADTWMDAKRQGKYPCSPRGNRANDIQALWWQQLEYAATFARLMNHNDEASRWQNAADKVKQSFLRDFIDHQGYNIADHINADGSCDTQFRPNLLYTFDLIDDRELTDSLTRRVWEQLVYPWGVASLDQHDPMFHPYHENWHYYHKDDAYHNGTVWLWNNGMAMQRMIEAGQTDVAWQLFENMNRQALVQGAVGSLSENADAWPLPGASWAGRSGTFLQAWSNAEHIRVWYQYFLGILPSMLTETIFIEPAVPSEITHLRYSSLIAQGRLEGGFTRHGRKCIYAYRAINLSAELVFDIANYDQCSVKVTPGITVTLTTDNDTMEVRVTNDAGKELDRFTVNTDDDKASRRAQEDQRFRDVRLAVPTMDTDLPSLRRYFDPPLDYSSVE